MATSSFFSSGGSAAIDPVDFNALRDTLQTQTQQATSSATAAASSEANAAASETNAASSATTASTAATTATTAATNASSSASAASTSASNAATSASNASASATSASTSATNAATSATNAASSATAASTSATNAANSATQAANTLASKADLTALTAHTGNTSNPHGVTKAQVGLGNVDNTSDLAKPVSTAQQTALDLKANAANSALTGTTSVANITFTGTGGRILGDFSNAALASRVAFQTSTANTATIVGILPNGTSTTAGISAFAASDPTNTSIVRMRHDGTLASLASVNSGTGTVTPLAFLMSTTEAARFDTSCNFLIGTSGTAAGILHARKDQVGATYIAVENQDTTAGNAAGLLLRTPNGDWTLKAKRSGGFGISTPTTADVLNIDNTGAATFTGTGERPMYLETTGTSNAASLHIKSGNGTTSGKYAYVRLFNNDTNGQDWRIGTYGSDALTVYNAKAGTTAMTLDTSGNLGLSVTPSAWGSGKAFEFGFAGTALWAYSASESYITQGIYNSSTGWKYAQTGVAITAMAQNAGAYYWYKAPSGTAGAAATLTAAMTLDNSGNLLVGATSGSVHILSKAVSEGSDIAYMQAGSTVVAAFKAATTQGWNVANAAFYTAKNSSTSRSINVSGTVNASGADYAEYMRKALDCGTIAKGAIVGVNSAGELTDKWSDAISFVVKSTDPSYVGGDTWGSEEVLGITRPNEPQRKADVTEQGLVSEAVAEERDEAGDVTVASQEAQYDTVILEAGDTDEEWEAKQAAYQAALKTFEDTLEAARQQVDRIAFAGQVPVNVLGATVGDYIVPVQDGEGIKGVAVAKADMTFTQYMEAVGIVQNILPDGRANIRVKVA